MMKRVDFVAGSDYLCPCSSPQHTGTDSPGEEQDTIIQPKYPHKLYLITILVDFKNPSSFVNDANKSVDIF